MRHGKKFNHLSRKKGHRRALMMNMACSLIRHKRINTTLAKAKALRTYAEPLITRCKVDSTHNRRVVFSYLQDKEIITELFSTVSTAIADRPGGYLRIIKTGTRQGDAAEMAMIEFVDFNSTYKNVKGTKSSTKRKRTRRGGKGKTSATPAPAPIVSSEEE